MKTNKQNTKRISNSNNTESTNSNGNSSGLLNRTEQSSTASETAAGSENPKSKIENQTSIKPYVNFELRERNRQLSVERVLEILKRWNPAQYKLAEVVGNWIWITFPEPPIERVRAELSQLGFHWNNVRKCWQHPCGETLPRGTQEPREKYSVWFPMASEKRRKEREAQDAAAAALGTAYGKRSLAQAAA
jgi:hypothetical protein